MNQAVLIAGATSMIGRACAHVFDEHGYQDSCLYHRWWADGHVESFDCSLSLTKGWVFNTVKFPCDIFAAFVKL